LNLLNNIHLIFNAHQNIFKASSLFPLKNKTRGLSPLLNNYTNNYSELLPLLETGASWEVSAFVSQIYLPSSSGSFYPDVFNVIHFAIKFNQKCNLSPTYRNPTTSCYLFVKF